MKFGIRNLRRRRPLWRKVRDVGLATALFAAAAFVAARLDYLATAEISGMARVVDGDSLAIGQRRLRLKGIDAPELKQRCRRGGFEFGCGVESASHLRGLIGNSAVSCRGEGLDRYGRDLVRCSVGGVDLNEAMVRSGQALAFGDYEAAELAARSAGAGVWAGEFDPPKRWRAVHGGLDEELHGGLNALMAFLRRLFGV